MVALPQLIVLDASKQIKIAQPRIVSIRLPNSNEGHWVVVDRMFVEEGRELARQVPPNVVKVNEMTLVASCLAIRRCYWVRVAPFMHRGCSLICLRFCCDALNRQHGAVHLIDACDAGENLVPGRHVERLHPVAAGDVGDLGL